MINPPWLILDVSYFAYRSLYSLGNLSYDGIETGAVFGIFKSALDLMEIFQTERIVWAFDRGYDGRLVLDSRYKAKRRDDETQELHESKRRIRNQLYKLREKYLPRIGFGNIFYQDGYEADDVIASVCENLSKGDSAIIVSPDNDLYQLLREDKIIIFNPATDKPITEKSFSSEWGIGPSQWKDAKAIAGCPGDNVVGIEGVGLKTACQFLTGTLKETTKKYQSIIKNNDIWKQNLPLVSLPFPGTRQFIPKDDNIDDSKWRMVMDELGMKTLRNKTFRKG